MKPIEHISPELFRVMFPGATASALARNGVTSERPAPKTGQHSSGTRSRRHGSGCEDRWVVECLPGLLSGGECVRRQFWVRVSPDDAVEEVRYTADFAIWRPLSPTSGFWKCVLWEVKDTRRKPHSDELTRPKLARMTNPWISEIWLATWDGNQWETRQLA